MDAAWDRVPRRLVGRISRSTLLGSSLVEDAEGLPYTLAPGSGVVVLAGMADARETC